MGKSYDIIIIGGGVAGLTAAIYAARAGMRICVVENMFTGGQTAITSNIENYPGFAAIDGAELATTITAQAEASGAEIVYENIDSVKLEGEIKAVNLASGEITSKSIIIATGAAPRKLGVDGEEKFSGRGVSYCATCDGALYKNKAVMVIGGGNSAVEEALYLAGFASKVYVTHRRSAFRATEIEINKLKNTANVTLLMDSEAEKIVGEKSVNAVIIRNKITQEAHSINVNGVFIAIGRLPQTVNGMGGITIDESGYIITDEEMRTGIPNVYAVGDVRRKSLRQIVTAVADGAIAGNNAVLAIKKL